MPAIGYILIGFFGLLVATIWMLKLRSQSQQSVQQWLADHQFVPTESTNAQVLFNQTMPNSRINYQSYLSSIGDVPFQFVIQNTTSQNNGHLRLEIQCMLYFNANTNADELEQKFKTLKENSPHSPFFSSQFRAFDIKDCAILRPAIGGVAVAWFVPNTYKTYQERYEWIKKALTN